MRSPLYLSIAALLFSATLVTVAVFTSTPEPRIEAQSGGGSEHFGGKFSTITNICCDATWIIEHEAVQSGLPEGSFKGDLGSQAYLNTFYWPLPGACALGYVRSSGSCITVSSYCESTETPDYTITMIGTSLPGCQFVSTDSSGSGSGGGF
ncbi:MAG: hypothetical protein WDZ79_02105 [Candidatus Paceibacterota bacterium]